MLLLYPYGYLYSSFLSSNLTLSMTNWANTIESKHSFPISSTVATCYKLPIRLFRTPPSRRFFVIFNFYINDICVFNISHRLCINLLTYKSFDILNSSGMKAKNPSTNTNGQLLYMSQDAHPVNRGGWATLVKHLVLPFSWNTGTDPCKSVPSVQSVFKFV